MISTFDLFTIGIGPSSSHTLGPMRAAKEFAFKMGREFSTNIHRVRIELFGSLGATGRGHCTDKAILLGLEGNTPEQIDPNIIDDRLEQIRSSKKLCFMNAFEIPFHEKDDLIFYKGKRLPLHSNGMRFWVYDKNNLPLGCEIYYSIGGGFIVQNFDNNHLSEESGVVLPYNFTTAKELLLLCKAHNKAIWEIVLENERCWRSDEQILSQIKSIWKAMQDCVERGCRTEGILPGGLNVIRRAPSLLKSLQNSKTSHPAEIMEWVSLYALAVNEENAAGSRVVTAPTNGAAGVLPAVMYYIAKHHKPDYDDQDLLKYFLTCGAIGMLFKFNASISAAEVGCQGEVGVACSMAAAGLSAVLGATNEQVENAAEIGMEHNLGLTCDPVGGLVQIPCIERNTMGSIKAINAAILALRGSGLHKISLDHVIATMLRTGKDMQSKYKETSKGGLAVNTVEC